MISRDHVQSVLVSIDPVDFLVVFTAMPHFVLIILLVLIVVFIGVGFYL